MIGLKKIFGWRLVNSRNNSISCFDNFISCFPVLDSLVKVMKILKKKFFDQGLGNRRNKIGSE